MSESATNKNASEPANEKPRRSDHQRKRRDHQRKRRTKHGGRKPGTPNVLTRELTEAVIQAAERVGRDLKGADGLTGYLMRVGRKDTKAFGSLLRAVLPLRIDLETEIEGERPWTLEDYEAHFSRRRLPLPFWMPAYFNGGLEALAEQLEKELSLEVKLLPKD
jgi:hypothetical protein